jgi:hypothetical protein
MESSRQIPAYLAVTNERLKREEIKAEHKLERARKDLVDWWKAWLVENGPNRSGKAQRPAKLCQRNSITCPWLSGGDMPRRSLTGPSRQGSEVHLAMSSNLPNPSNSSHLAAGNAKYAEYAEYADLNMHTKLHIFTLKCKNM